MTSGQETYETFGVGEKSYMMEIRGPCDIDNLGICKIIEVSSDSDFIPQMAECDGHQWEKHEAGHLIGT